ncbi:MAG TPA: dihydroneopterin aldolase [Nitrospiraceae bacterium]|nr:dihydroneopterin aldolase [Nitrospiraceae bacterium]
MPARIVIERLEFQASCGVTDQERRIPQPIAVDVEVEGRPDQAGEAAVTDDLRHTIDYAQIAERLVQVGAGAPCHLLETMAERMLATLFAEFPVEAAYLWVRKVHPPVKSVQGSVGVQIKRTRQAHMNQRQDPLPARFLVEQLHRLPRGRALDVASGAGRNAMYLAANGFQVDCIDRDEQALIALNTMAQERHLATLSTKTIDLETDPVHIPDLGTEQYDVVLVFFYLYRPLFPRLIQALKPGGMLVYETFTVANHLKHQHPRRREFCLEPNELIRLIHPLHILCYDEGEHAGSDGAAPLWTAQLLAQKV